MANYSNRVKDPTETALSAIQDALNVRNEQQGAPGQPGIPAASEAGEADGKAPGKIDARWRPPAAPTDHGLPHDDARRGSPRPDEQPRIAANDDRQTIGQILQTLQPRRGGATTIVATGLAVTWAVLCFGLTWVYLPQLQAVLGGGAAAAPVLLALGAAFVAPIVFFYVVANMVARARELRLIAQSMAQVAMRLAEPETVVQESLVNVGQAIRREVAAMGDGVERALARAAELEALVHNEVSALERAYNDNEVRIRGLLEDLAHQRETLVGQAEQVRNAITSVHLDLTHDIQSVSNMVTERVNDIAQRITSTLADKGEGITLALGRAGDNMIGVLSERAATCWNGCNLPVRKPARRSRPPANGSLPA